MDLVKKAKGTYHFLLAYVGAVVYGYPSRELFVIGVTGTKGKSTVLEILAAGLLVVGIVLFGLWPAPMIELSAATITQMHQQISQRLL